MERRAKEIKKVLVFLLCMVMVQGICSLAAPAARAEAATVKKGLVKEGKYYYYYQNNKKVKNTWKTVRSARYYFGSNGRAYAAPDMTKTDNYKQNIVVKKIGKYYYGFDNKGRMVKSGYYNNPQKLDSNGDSMTYYFDRNGRYQAAKSKAVRKAGAYGKDAVSVRRLLGKPKSIEKLNSCFGEPGDDYQWNYTHIYVTVHIYPDETGIVFGIFPR